METSSEQIQGNGAQPGKLPLSQVKLLRAGELAKTGDYEAALVLLLQMEPTPAALDMRARIEVQRGHYADARALWDEVLELVPGHAGAKKGLRSVQSAIARSKLLRQLGLVVVLLAAAGAMFLVIRPSATPPAQVHVQAPSLPPTAAAVRSAPPPPPPAAAIAAASPKLPEIALPEGVSMRVEDGAQIYRFEDGLFDEGVTFIAGGKEKVTPLGRALAPYAEQVQIELIGYGDTLPEAATERQYQDNTELALRRANAVLGRLTRTTRLSAEALVLRAVGRRLGSSPDPRDRTVAIRVRLRAQH
jgi:flagellar motor protein MotB